MKVAIITDTHAGIKNGSGIFLDSAERFYSEAFFPRLLEEGITRILHLGDYFDHRKFVNFKVLSRNKEMFIDRLIEHGIHMDLIPGNHDVFYKNTNNLCSLKEILGQYSDAITIHMDPTVVQYGSLEVALIPWINPENHSEIMTFIKNVRAPFLGAHLELQGFEMMKGLPLSSHGMDASVFDRFESVLSGHYHTKSSKGNVHYLGTPYEMTWSDSNDPKYWHILDTETRTLSPVRNPITLFNKMRYDDSSASSNIREELEKVDFSSVKGSFVKVIVGSKKNPFLFDKYIDAILANDPFDLKIVENLDGYLAENVDNGSIEITDTSTLLNTYVDAVETDLDRERIKSKLHQFYLEAQAMDTL
jgi:DNA repair exonuclease SbcCD nuclease subunit